MEERLGFTIEFGPHPGNSLNCYSMPTCWLLKRFITMIETSSISYLLYLASLHRTSLPIRSSSDCFHFFHNGLSPFDRSLALWFIALRLLNFQEDNLQLRYQIGSLNSETRIWIPWAGALFQLCAGRHPPMCQNILRTTNMAPHGAIFI